MTDRTLRVLTLACAVLTGALLIGALLADSRPRAAPDDVAATGGHHAAMPSRPSEPMTVRQLADGIGCDLNLAEGKRAGFRQGSCDIDGRITMLLDFDTAKGQRDWLELSQHHSGVFYLVGERWILTAYTLAEISLLQDRFGGEIKQGHHKPPPGL